MVGYASCSGEGEKNTAINQPKKPANTELSQVEKIAFGKKVYDRVCITCHMADGTGVAGTFPPLAKSDYLIADIDRAIHGVANGLKGEITVNGVKYNQEMPKPIPELTDEELSNVFTYVLNSFENPGGEVNVEQAKKARVK